MSGVRERMMAAIAQRAFRGQSAGIDRSRRKWIHDSDSLYLNWFVASFERKNKGGMTTMKIINRLKKLYH